MANQPDPRLDAHKGALGALGKMIAAKRAKRKAAGQIDDPSEADINTTVGKQGTPGEDVKPPGMPDVSAQGMMTQDDGGEEPDDAHYDPAKKLLEARSGKQKSAPRGIVFGLPSKGPKAATPKGLIKPKLLGGK